MANLAKTNIEVSFKKNPRLNPKNKKILFLVTVNITRYIFPKNFIEIHHVSQKI